MNQPQIVGTVRKAECAQCRGERNCEVKGHFEEKGGDENISWWVDWHLLQCRGCEHVFVQRVSGNSEDYDPYYTSDGSVGYEPLTTKTYWPALAARTRPDWMTNYGIRAEGTYDLDQPLVELYAALDADLRILAGIGIRTCIDVASEILGIDPAITFEEKLTELVEKEHIGRLDMDRLNVLVEAGNATAHRGWRPTKADIETMMDVLEMFVNEAFIVPEKRRKLDEQSKKISQRVPPKPKRQQPRQRKKKPVAGEEGALPIPPSKDQTPSKTK